ncbi:hypothetical protein, unlikely [Trypanosoma congolense IL3000]|uniref:Variant surface glycoprotein n=1 Tax=Trypanosoma congolense (strain IL3000) TaxID=1068625 RepID=F9WIV6_TRYCI|nr:hypothetical protein, unlikely [Trypanosoma congolense IL3000]
MMLMWTFWPFGLEASVHSGAGSLAKALRTSLSSLKGSWVKLSVKSEAAKPLYLQVVRYLCQASKKQGTIPAIPGLSLQADHPDHDRLMTRSWKKLLGMHAKGGMTCILPILLLHNFREGSVARVPT